MLIAVVIVLWLMVMGVVVWLVVAPFIVIQHPPNVLEAYLV